MILEQSSSSQDLNDISLHDLDEINELSASSQNLNISPQKPSYPNFTSETDWPSNRKVDQSETRFKPVGMKMVPSNIIEKIVGSSQNEISESETIQPISVDYSLEFQKLQEAEKLKDEKNAEPKPETTQKTQKRKSSFNPRIAKSKSASSYLDKFVKVRVILRHQSFYDVI